MLNATILRHAATLMITLVLLAQPSMGEASCNPTCSLWKMWVGSGTLFHFDANVPQDWRNAFTGAMNEWNQAHAGYGRSDMYLGYAPGTGLRIVVEVPKLGSGYVGEWDPDDNVIRINPSYLNLPTEQKIALALHEFGHQLGYEDASSSCYGHTVMGPSGPNSPYGLTTYDYCGLNYYYDPFCEAGGGTDYYNHCTPLVLSFTGSFPVLSTPQVTFDIAADGGCPRLGWLRRGADAFLVLDRNGDGVVSTGAELFGNTTPLSASLYGTKAWSGFNALAFFDFEENGGNGNWIIDPGDSIFSQLRLWFDTNRDGFSQPGELISLAQRGVEYINLRAFAMNDPDPAGNLRWFGTTFVFRSGGTLREGHIVDVILATARN
jgi:hypothetical protein